jgi:MOZ/SAS family
VIGYLLSKKEGRPGSPEKPLSGLGALGYRNYWTLAVMRFLETSPPNPRLEGLSSRYAFVFSVIESLVFRYQHSNIVDYRGHLYNPQCSFSNYHADTYSVVAQTFTRSVDQDQGRQRRPQESGQNCSPAFAAYTVTDDPR